MSKAPYPKRQSAQYKAPAFYWRGGDILKEREYLADEYKKALADYRKAEYELKMLEEELANANETLHEREGYTTALANYLDADAEGNQTEHDCKKQLAELELEIREAEVELQQVKAVHHPAVASGLQKEKAYLTIEMQRTIKAIDLTSEQQNDEKRKLAEISISKKYQTSVDLETKLMEIRRKSQFLRNLVNKNKKDFDNTKPVQAIQTPNARQERSVMSQVIDANYSLTRVNEKSKRRPGKWSAEIDRILTQIEDLNQRMSELGMSEDQMADIESLREKYMDNGEEEPSPEQEQEE